MSLINCPGCGKEISDEFKFCPECGTKISAPEDNGSTYLEDPDEINMEDESPVENIAGTHTSTMEESRDFLLNHLHALKRHKGIIILIIVVILIVSVTEGISIYKSGVNYDKGIDSLNKGEYTEAIAYLEKSKVSDTEESLDLAYSLKESEENYNLGVDLFGKKEYEDAIEKLSSVTSDFPKYNEAKDMINESKSLAADDYLQQAKTNYTEKDYISAFELLQTALGYNPSLEEAVELNKTYAAKYTDEQEKIKKQKEKDELQAKKDNMNTWEGFGVYIAVGKAYKKSSTSLHVANGNGTFVYIHVGALNKTDFITHVNPNDFTLSTSTGYTVSHDSDTYSLSNYFDAVDLGPNQQTGGYLIFYTNNESEYTLSYNGMDGSASKVIVF